MGSILCESPFFFDFLVFYFDHLKEIDLSVVVRRARWLILGLASLHDACRKRDCVRS